MFNFHLLDYLHVHVYVCVCTFNLGLFICLTLLQCLCKILPTVSVVIPIVTTLSVSPHCQLTWLIVGVNRVEICTNMPVTTITCSFLDSTLCIYEYMYFARICLSTLKQIFMEMKQSRIVSSSSTFSLPNTLNRMNVFQFDTIGCVHVNASIISRYTGMVKQWHFITIISKTILGQLHILGFLILLLLSLYSITH